MAALGGMPILDMTQRQAGICCTRSLVHNPQRFFTGGWS